MESINIKGKENFLQKVKQQVSGRDYELIEKAVRVLQDNVVWDETLPWGKKRCVVPCMQGFPGIWNWDTAFHCLGLSRMDPEFAMEHMETFCSYQKEDGLFPDVIFLMEEWWIHSENRRLWHGPVKWFTREARIWNS